MEIALLIFPIIKIIHADRENEKDNSESYKESKSHLAFRHPEKICN